MPQLNQRVSFAPTDLRIREAQEGGESRTIEGYAIVFGRESEPLHLPGGKVMREIIAREAVTPELLGRSDIVMTLYHDSHRLLARSNKGDGTLSYTIDDHGVAFAFDAPRTADGDAALELVRRRDIAGCSFAFLCDYGDRECVKVAKRDGETICTVVRIESILDFTLTPHPAYPATSVTSRDLDLEEPSEPEAKRGSEQAQALRAKIAKMKTHKI